MLSFDLMKFMIRPIRASFLSKIKNGTKYYSSSIAKKLLPIEIGRRHNMDEQEDIRPTSKIYLRALSAKESGQSGSLFVYTNQEKYLFNCGDGLTRIVSEYDPMHNRKNKLYGIFITANHWKKISGIMSMQLCLQDEDPEAKLNIFCPKGLKNSLLPIMKEVFWEKNSRKHVKLPCFFELQEKENILERALSIKHVPIYSSNKQRSSMSNKSSHLGLSSYVLAYVCYAKSNIHNVLSMKKLIQCNVPPGPLVTELHSGGSVVLPNGSIVQQEDVVKSYGDSGLSFIVLDIPSKDYLDSLLSWQDFNPNQNFKSVKEENYPRVIVHFSPVEVMEDERFLKWVKLFPPTVEHMVINESSRSCNFQKAVSFQQTLHHFLPAIFPLPIDDEKEISSTTHNYHFPGHTVQAQSGLLLSLRPNFVYDESYCSKNLSKDVSDITTEIKELKNKFMELKKPEHCIYVSNEEYPCIHFLGTVSKRSTSYRNTSSILVHVNQDSCLLLDCGPGTLNQLYLQFGLEGTHKVLQNLKLIYISHFHGDHFLGLNSLLYERSKIYKDIFKIDPPDPLFIMAIPTVFTYLKVLQDFHPLIYNLNLVSNRSFYYKKKKNETNLLIERILALLDLDAIKTTTVPHCSQSYGVALTHKDGWKLVYSGDTLPSTELINMGNGCDILIHEATFEDGRKEEAAIKKHCTISQAIEVARRMKAKNVILTHFSQRYSNIPIVEGELPDNTCLAFDNMKVWIKDFPNLAHLYPVLKEMFADKYEKLKWQAELKERRKTRNR